MLSALIIDADQDATASIETTLASYGFEFTSTTDAGEALSLARATAPDIVFLRVELPNVSGFSVCNKLRRAEGTRGIPLVMYASDVSEDVFSQHRNLKTHADAYLNLPFRDSTLIDAVEPLVPLRPAAQSSQTDLEVDLEDLNHLGETPEPDLNEETDAAFDALMADEDPELDDDPEPPEAFEPVPADSLTPTDSADDATTQPTPRIESAPELRPASAEIKLSAPTAAAPAPTPVPTPPPRPDDATPSAGPAEFKLQREVIHLKSQLNAKNREILALKDELESQERSVLDAKHKNRELLAQIGDLEEKLLAVEDANLTAQEQAKSALRDKTTILKREEGLKTRFEHAQNKLKELEEQLSTTTESRTQAVADLGSTQIAIREKEEALVAAHARAAALEDQVGRLETELAQAKTEAQTAAQRATTDFSEKLAEAERATDAEVARAIASQAAEHQAEVEFNEAQHRKELEKVRQEAETAQRAMVTEVEQLRATVADAENAASDERARLARELSDEQARGADEVASMQAKQEELQAELEAVTRQVETLREELVQASGSLEARDRELGSRRDAERRASQALAVALRVLDGEVDPPTQSRVRVP